LSSAFPVQFLPKQKALSPLLFYFASEQCSTTLLHPQHTLICQQIYGGTPQNFASSKVIMKVYMAVNMYVHKKPCLVRMQEYENKT
jgi:hypothetical protein